MASNDQVKCRKHSSLVVGAAMYDLNPMAVSHRTDVFKRPLEALPGFLWETCLVRRSAWNLAS